MQQQQLQQNDINNELRDSINAQIVRGLRSTTHIRSNYTSGRIQLTSQQYEYLSSKYKLGNFLFLI